MSAVKSPRRKRSSIKSSQKNQIKTKQARVLGPIYDKVAFLREQMEQKYPAPNFLMSQELPKVKAKQHFIELEIDRNTVFQNRKQQSMSQQLKTPGEGRRQAKTITNWRSNNRSSTKSLVNFLKTCNTVPSRMSKQQQLAWNSPRHQSFIQKEVDNQEQFAPLGEQYLREKVYQDSLKSQTFSVVSKQQSSIRLSKIGTANSKDQNSRNYLRKGTRVRQILMRQLSSADGRTSSRESMTYLKQYDQWVPSILVQQKKGQLQAFMNIMYGEKKTKAAVNIDLNKMELIYL